MTRLALIASTVVLALGMPLSAQDALPPAADDFPVRLEPFQDWDDPQADSNGVVVWGLAGVRVDALGERMAPNGVPFDPLFSLDLDILLALEKCERWYLFAGNRFWGQKPTANVTNGDQGNLDFSKREYDLTGGVAWNYYGNWELRGFGYSQANLNRGDSLARPKGFKDGVGIENRLYLSNLYGPPVRTRYDVARTNFLSIGYFPSKGMIGGDGLEFKPSFFARAFLTYDLLGEACYLFGDVELICSREAGFEAKLFNADLGVASRPFRDIRGLEFRIGSEGIYDVQDSTARPLWYFALRFIF